MLKLLSKWHIWIGWLVSVPLLIWTISGLIMVSRPIEHVRGDHLRTPAETISTQGLVLPQWDGQPLASLNLVSQHGKPLWILEAENGERRRIDAQSGKILDDVSPNEARALALASFSGDAAFTKVTYFTADKPPIDLRRNRPSWQAVFGDDTRIYIDAETGQVLAIRTQFWRIFDFMWGLHIMDLQSREDTSHPLLIGFSALAALSVLLGVALLFRRHKRKRAYAT